jgi:hypothetical protein
LRVWVDGNGDGVTDAGELKTLADLGITEIGLAADAAGGRAELGWNMPLATAAFVRSDGSTSALGAVAFAFEPGQPVGEGSSVAQQAASQLAQAMGRFGADLSADGLRDQEVETMNRLDWFGPKAA